jgi:hypothetical protein
MLKGKLYNDVLRIAIILVAVVVIIIPGTTGVGSFM